MKRKRVMTIFVGLVAFLGLLNILVGKFILGGGILLVAAGLYYIVVSGIKDEDRRRNRTVENSSGIFVQDVYELFKNMETPLGKCWIGRHDFFYGECVIFGPGPFKDYIAAGKNKDTGNIELINSSVLSRLHADDDEKWRLEQVLDTSTVEANAKNYSLFAGAKMVNNILLDNLEFYLDEFIEGEDEIPDSLDEYKVYHYDSGDSIVRDKDDEKYAKMSTVYKPLSIIMYDLDGGEKGSIIANGTGENGGYNIALDGKVLGTMYRDTSSSHDEYVLGNDDHEVRLVAFPAIREANLSCNYIVAVDGVQQAVLGANFKIKFSEEKNAKEYENEIICCFDDEYLYLDFLLADFLLAKNDFVR